MEKFSLEKWLQDKSRKIVTRSGHEVCILYTYQRGNMPIVALAKFETLDGIQMFYTDGKNESRREYDLFFANEEEELTEFEKELEMMMVSFSNGNLGSDVRKEMPKQMLHDYAHRLLNLARKEILKDLPKWKKSKPNEKYIYNKGYYITWKELETLPKEE